METILGFEISMKARSFRQPATGGSSTDGGVLDTSIMRVDPSSETDRYEERGLERCLVG
jgi:hypothetical protein